ncbi:MAG TPA: hypothetical protein VEA80_12410 [Vitreimonas sp.]|nr:hypothetical protein [Vitreimonas sp.]
MTGALKTCRSRPARKFGALSPEAIITAALRSAHRIEFGNVEASPASCRYPPVLLLSDYFQTAVSFQLQCVRLRIEPRAGLAQDRDSHGVRCAHALYSLYDNQVQCLKITTGGVAQLVTLASKLNQRPKFAEGRLWSQI